MHQREKYFGEDAELFIPERWETFRPRVEYLPFRAGPRICIGRKSHLLGSFCIYVPEMCPILTLWSFLGNLGLIEESYIIERLAQEFKTLQSRDPRLFFLTVMV